MIVNSLAERTIRVWEWKGGTLPFETDGGSAPYCGEPDYYHHTSELEERRIKAVAVIALLRLPLAWTGWDLNGPVSITALSFGWIMISKNSLRSWVQIPPGPFLL